MIKTDLKSLFQDEDWRMVYSSWWCTKKYRCSHPSRARPWPRPSSCLRSYCPSPPLSRPSSWHALLKVVYSASSLPGAGLEPSRCLPFSSEPGASMALVPILFLVLARVSGPDIGIGHTAEQKSANGAQEPNWAIGPHQSWTHVLTHQIWVLAVH